VQEDLFLIFNSWVARETWQGINTHVHTSQQLGRGIVDDVDLLTWLHGRIWPYESHMIEEDSYLSTLLCGIELIHSGVGTPTPQLLYIESI
jgi:cytosine/adenosine deaminase-related metal-dependent hydrolase